METFAQFLVNGFALGGVYALLSLGFGVIYNTVRIFHVLHGAVFIAAGYITWVLQEHLGLPLAAAGMLGVVGAMVVGMLIEVGVYRPLRGRSAGFLTAFLASLAGMFFVEGFLVAAASTDLKVLKQGPLSTFHLGDVAIAYFHVIIIIVVVILFSAVTVFLRSSKWGRMIRAVASNPDLALSVGIDSNQVFLMVFALGSTLAGIAGIFRAYDVGLEPVVGLQLAIIASIGVIIGGIGSLPGAALGGLTLGLAQTLVAFVLSGQWSQPVAIIIMLGFIVFRPYGLLGTREHRELRRLL